MNLTYKEFGKNRPHLVILHGLLGSSKNWHQVARRLGQQLHVVVPDQRNHGDSPHGKHSLQLLRDDVWELLQRLQLEKVVLMGHSMGGLAAMSFALAYPQLLSGLIVVDMAPQAQLGNIPEILDALASVDLADVKRREDADRQLAERIGNASIRQFLLQNLRRREDGSYAWRCNLPELQRFVRRETRLELNQRDQYAGPTLFVGGELSEQNLAGQQGLLVQHFPNYQLVMIPDAGHWVHFDAPLAFVETVLNFIKRIAGTTPPG
ncbi:MAG: alpha/beta fold hydrolase [bacterium]